MKSLTPIQSISQQLISLSSHSTLSSLEVEYLIQIINQLFVDLEAGHSCSRISELSDVIKLSATKILKILNGSSLVTLFKNIPSKLLTTPITVLDLNDECLIYVTKYLYYELDIARRVIALTASANLDSNPEYKQGCMLLEQIQAGDNIPNNEQLHAIQNTLTQKFSIITGGPGTGKTTTVTLLLWLMYCVYGSTIKVKICAPTGKASKRVKESIENSVANFQGKQAQLASQGLDSLIANNSNFVTIHKLLGYQQHSIYFKHNQNLPLELDVLVIDESSMLGLALFSKLLQAINVGTIKHIIFLGDKNQLSSVEEGSVFSALVNSNKQSAHHDLFSQQQSSPLSELLISNRNAGDVGRLAEAVLHNNISQLNQILDKSATIKIVEAKLDKILSVSYKALYNYIDYVNILDTSSLNMKDLFKQYNQQILLCLTNIGWLGSINLNQVIENKIKRQMQISSLWYSGRAIIILENDYSLGLSNGDIGICIVRDGVAKIVFAGIEDREVIPEGLPKHQLAYAISIHKSQGSEYQHVNLVIHEGEANSHTIATRELVYTAITRAKQSVTIFSSRATIEQALNNVTVRNTGLNYFLTL